MERLATAVPPSGWPSLIEDARHRIGALLGPTDVSSYSYDPNTYINLFGNTTGAIGRLVSQIDRDFGASKPTLLTTDLEFPGCLSAIDDAWAGPMVITRVSEDLLTHVASAGNRLDHSLVRAHNFVKPGVIFLSHVSRTTGQLLSEKVLAHFREANPRALIIIDGSQAIGNVEIKRSFLELADFYIGSGHKWLGGKTTSGFVWRRDPVRWDVADPTQSLSRNSQMGGTGNSAAWISLVATIDDMLSNRPAARAGRIARHNRALGRRFIDGLDEISDKVEVLTPRPRKRLPQSGLVTIALPQSARLAVQELRKRGFAFTELDYETVLWQVNRSEERGRFLLDFSEEVPAIHKVGAETATHQKKPRVELRFCFHYWHSDADVNQLASELVSTVKSFAS